MKTIIVCCSLRFLDTVKEEAKVLRAHGIGVETPMVSMKGVYDTLDASTRHYLAAGMTFTHFQRIREADVVWVYNPGGYIGTSVTMEMAFATALGKPIYVLEPDTDDSRGTLVTGVRRQEDFIAEYGKASQAKK